MTAELRDVLVSVLFGLGMIVFFISVVGMIWAVAYAIAWLRRVWDLRRQSGEGRNSS